ncbi:hypothetical protein NC651_004794 [Populus alba x Populus x berolinensis]|nr:hypothetical protein NC651_004794 [Populus alba x Populus x berolinensis]
MDNVRNQGVNICCPQKHYLEKFQNCWFFGYEENHRLNTNQRVVAKAREQGLREYKSYSSEGISPHKLLKLKSREAKLLQYFKDEGMDPLIWLLERYRVLKLVKLPNKKGIKPGWIH